VRLKPWCHIFFTPKNGGHNVMVTKVELKLVICTWNLERKKTGVKSEHANLKAVVFQLCICSHAWN
jgi:hypothetical protein